MGFFGTGGNVLNLTLFWLNDSVNILKNTELYTLNGWIVFVNYISIKLKFKKRWSRKTVKIRRHVAEDQVCYGDPLGVERKRMFVDALKPSWRTHGSFASTGMGSGVWQLGVGILLKILYASRPF